RRPLITASVELRSWQRSFPRGEQKPQENVADDKRGAEGRSEAPFGVLLRRRRLLGPVADRLEMAGKHRVVVADRFVHGGGACLRIVVSWEGVPGRFGGR